MFGKNVVCLLFTVFLHTVAEAQQPKKVPRIGYLGSSDPVSDSARSAGIRLALRELGYIVRTEHRHRIPICGGEARSDS